MAGDTAILSGARIAIVGLGLMGGSLALALRGKCAALLGIEVDPATAKLACKMNAVDEVSSDPASLLPQASIIILATPVNCIIQFIHVLPDLHPGSPLVLDLGSTKVSILKAMQGLPERFDPVGGHPMCGKEQSGLENADALLFRSAAFAFTPLPRTSSRARNFCLELAQAIGAHPLWLDPSVHDTWVASTSHLPYLVASALALATPPETAPVAGPGYRSSTRLASNPAAMMIDVLMSNRENILASIHRFQEQIDLLRDLLDREDFSSLRELLVNCADRQNEFLSNARKGNIS